jgi:hypothetical protein
MRRLAAPLFAVATFAAGAMAVGAESAAPPLPPVRGDVSGQLTLPRIPGLPPLAWTVQMQPVEAGSPAFAATAKAAGLELEVQFTLPRGETAGSWRIVKATIEAAEWWRLSAEQAGLKSLPDDFTFTGQLVIEGAGQWRGAEASGELRTRLHAGTAGSVSGRWSATGVTAESELQVVKGKIAVKTAQVRVETLLAAGAQGRGLALDIVGGPGGVLSVTRAEVSGLGGRIVLTRFTIDPAEPAMTATADFENLSLSEIAILVPQAVKEASGRIAGKVTLTWSSKAGLTSAGGSLAMLPGEAVVLRLAESPGLLTSRMPARISLLGDKSMWTRWLALDNPAYDVARRVEGGELPLNVDGLEMRFYPDAAETGRTAQIQIAARPADPNAALKHLTFTVNVAGPLDQVVRLGLDKRSSLQLGTGK